MSATIPAVHLKKLIVTALPLLNESLMPAFVPLGAALCSIRLFDDTVVRPHYQRKPVPIMDKESVSVSGHMTPGTMGPPECAMQNDQAFRCAGLGFEVSAGSYGFPDSLIL